MVIGMLTGWSDHAVMTPVRGDDQPKGGAAVVPPGLTESAEVVYSLRPAPLHNLVVTVVSSEVCMRKTVSRNGGIDVVIEREADRVRLRTEDMALAVTQGCRTIRPDVSRLTHEDVARVRRKLTPSRTVLALRMLATAVDETESDTAERLSMRLTGALIAQFDGDPGAVRRLSRELHARYGPQLKRGRGQVPDDWWSFQKAVVRSCAELQLGIAGLSCWNLSRHACALRWLTQVEAAWHGYVTASLAWKSRL